LFLSTVGAKPTAVATKVVFGTNVGMFSCFPVFVLPEYVETMRWTGALFKHSYQMSEIFIVISELERKRAPNL
jgi:hypothetical protein